MEPTNRRSEPVAFFVPVKQRRSDPAGRSKPSTPTTTKPQPSRPTLSTRRDTLNTVGGKTTATCQCREIEELREDQWELRQDVERLRRRNERLLQVNRGMAEFIRSHHRVRVNADCDEDQPEDKACASAATQTAPGSAESQSGAMDNLVTGVSGLITEYLKSRGAEIRGAKASCSDDI